MNPNLFFHHARALVISFVAAVSFAGIFTTPSAQALTSTSADNTKVNVRDRSVTEVTADSQSSNTTDTEITRGIRQALIKDDTLSTYAHNIKIITQGGIVTLKGPVQTALEKSRVADEAKAVPGVTNVENQLSVVR